MRIEIEGRLAPFSHRPGTFFLLPRSKFALKVYPTCIQLYDLTGSAPLLEREFHLRLTGPVANFTVFQDLERGFIRVFGRAKEGFFRYRVFGTPFGIEIEKGPSPLFDSEVPQWQGGVNFEKQSRLSFGMHKKLECERLLLRRDLKELLPIWHRLGQGIPGSFFSSPGLCQLSSITLQRPFDLPSFQNLFDAGFKSFFIPRNQDEEFQGFSLPPLPRTVSPLALLKEGADLIERLFFKREGGEVHFLPCLPSQFSAGRFIAVREYSLEWSKKELKKVIIEPVQDQEVRLVFDGPHKTCRFKESKAKGTTLLSNRSSVFLQSEKKYFLDCFS